MKRRNFHIPVLLFRRIAGKSTKKERRIVEDWKNASPANRQLLDELNDPVYLDDEWRQFNEIDLKANWENLVPRLMALEKPPNPVFVVVRRYAAVWIPVLLVAAGLIYYALSSGRHPAAVVETRSRTPVAPVASPLSLTVYYKGYGPVAFDEQLRDHLVKMENLGFRRRGCQLLVSYLYAGTSNRNPFTVSSPDSGLYQVVLPDNSSVLLKPGTELTVDAGYGVQSRVVRLNGEAHFDVEPLRVAARESRDPGFTVDVAPPAALALLFRSSGIEYPAAGLHIEVTGTSFDVRARKTDTSIRAILLHGSIVIRRPNSEPETLQPGHAYVLGGDGRPRTVLVEDLVGQDYWKKDEFYFKNKPVGVIMAELSRWYGVPIVCPADFTDSFVVSGPRSQPIDFILDQMHATRHFNYIIKHDTIYVSR